MKRDERPSSPVRAAREALGLTQLELARRSGCSAAFISLVERAPVLLLPTIAPRLAQALGTSPDALLVACSCGADLSIPATQAPMAGEAMDEGAPRRTKRELEALLHRGGLSREEAKALLSGGFRALQNPRPEAASRER